MYMLRGYNQSTNEGSELVMSISYYTHEQFYFGVGELARMGVRFEADHDELLIKITGVLA
jgi:hypothetical protein